MEGVVKVFVCDEDGNKELYLITSIPFDLLSESDQQLFVDGVTIETEEDLGEFLQTLIARGLLMKRFIKKSAFILCGLLLSIIIIGQVFPQNESTVTAPVVAEKVLVPGGQSVGSKWTSEVF